MVNILSKWSKKLLAILKEGSAKANTNKLRIDIAKDFAKMPSGMDNQDGPDNGQKFREEYLLPKLDEAKRRGTVVVVNFDGVDGYGPGFLWGVFNRLIIKDRYSKAALDKILELEATSFFVTSKDIVEILIEEAEEERNNNQQLSLIS